MKTLNNKWGRYRFEVPEEGKAFRIKGVRFCKRSGSRLGCFDPEINCLGLTIVTLNDVYENRCHTGNRKLTYNRKQPKTG